jgi:hypothetical protein
MAGLEAGHGGGMKKKTGVVGRRVLMVKILNGQCYLMFVKLL